MLYNGFSYHVEDCERGGVERVNHLEIVAGHGWQISPITETQMLTLPYEKRRCNWCGAFHPSVPAEIRVKAALANG
jgi:hypothetical protein